MARQTSEKALCAEGENYIAKITDKLAPAFGVARGRLHRILERCAHHACMDATKDSNAEPHTAAAVRNGGVWISPKPWVALQILTPGEFISLFEHEELSRLGWLERFVQFWLLRWDLRGSSASVLAERLLQFIDLWGMHRGYLLAHGIPLHEYSPDWLHWRIGNLYPVKCPLVYPNFWFDDSRTWFGERPRILRGARPGDSRLRTHITLGATALVDNCVDLNLTASQLTYCSYDEAPNLPWIDEVAARWIEKELRPAFLVAKISVLHQVREALRNENAATLWPDASAILGRFLNRIDAGKANEFDVAFSIYPVTADHEDRLFSGSSGGLFRLLEFVGRCEKELCVGTFGALASRREELLRPFGADAESVARRSSYDGEPVRYPGSVYGFIKAGRRAEIERAADEFMENHRREQDFWDNFRQRRRRRVADAQSAWPHRVVERADAAGAPRRCRRARIGAPYYVRSRLQRRPGRHRRIRIDAPSSPIRSQNRRFMRRLWVVK
jgi:hypothetical protein